MAEQPPRTTQRAAHEILDFERPIITLEEKIAELEALSNETELDLSGQIDGLRTRLDALVGEIFSDLSPWQEVQLARIPGRPLATDYIDGMCDDWMELHGDRAFRDDPAIVTGLGRIGERDVLVVAHRKGRDLKEKLATNFGCAHPEGYRKALRKMKLAEKFGRPIVCLINTPGAYPGIGAEERGQAWAIAENLREMFALTVPIVAIVIGEGGSGGALGIGIGDRVMMLQHSYYSVISPEGCAAILWNDAKRASDAASALRLSSRDLHRLGVVDEVIIEPQGAAHRNPLLTIQAVKERILAALDELDGVDPDTLIAGRLEKFRKMGTVFSDQPAQPTPKPPKEETEEG